MAEAKLKLVPKEVHTPPHSVLTLLNRLNLTFEKKSFPYILCSLVTLNILALSTLFYFHNKLWVQVLGLSLRAKALEAKIIKKHTEEKKADLKKTTLAEIEDMTLFPMDPFLVNITSEQGPKYLQVQMELELSDATLEEEVTRAKAGIRDSIIVLFSSKSYVELQNSNSVKKIKAELIGIINNLVKTGKITQIYFTKFHFN